MVRLHWLLQVVDRRKTRIFLSLLCPMVLGIGCSVQPSGEIGLGTGGFTFPPGSGGASGFGGVDLSCSGTGGSGALILPGVGAMSSSSPVFDGLVTAADPPPPISGGTLLALRDGVTVVAADSDRDRVYVVDVSTGLTTPRWSIPLTIHDEPGRLVQDGAGMVHVVLRKAGALATINPTTGTVTLRRSVCSMPRGLAYDPTADRLIVACAGGELVTMTPTGVTPERVVQLDPDLRDVVVDGPRLMVSRFRSAELLVVDASGAVTERIRPTSFISGDVHSGDPFEPAVAWRTVGMKDGGAMMVHQRGMAGTIRPSPGGYGGLSPCDSIVHTAVTRMKSGQRSDAGAAMPGFVLPADMAVSPDGTRVAMIAAGNGHAQFGARMLFLANVDDVSSDKGVGCGMDDVHGPAQFPTCNARPGITPNPDGTCPAGFLLCSPTDTCQDPSSFSCPDTLIPIAFLSAPIASGGSTGSAGAGGASGAMGGFGGTPVSIGQVPPSTCNLDVPSGMKIEPVAVTFVSATQVVVQSREPAQLLILATDGSSSARTVTLSQESRADTGHAIFHSNSGGGLACASCHPEGHEDGRVWNIGCEGPRRTQDISGGLIGTEPFHWNGDLGDFPTLVEAVFVGRMSGPQLDVDQTRAALSWINSVPSKPAQRPATDAQVLRGKAVFTDPTVGCVTCHAGKALTNNATVDVGTSGMFQVPSLRGVGWRAPYMHDGCAATLANRFGNPSCDGGDAHGRTSQLSAAQVSDVVAYLQSL